MRRVRLTERLARETKACERGCFLWDASVDGLALRIRNSELKSWVFDYRTRDGRRRRITLGAWPAWDLARARNEALRAAANVMGGGDPLEARRDARDCATFGDLVARYLERHARPRKKTWRDDERVIARELLPRWGKMKAEAVTRREVAAMHSDLGVRGEYGANRVLALVSSIFSWAERTGELPEGHLNPARRVERFKERSRDRWLSPDEVRAVMLAVEGESNIYVRGFFWLALLLGLRKSELLGLRWENVDLESATVRLPDTKAGRAHRLTLSPHALVVFRALRREAGTPFVFVGRFPGAHLSIPTVDQAWRRARRAAGAPDARIHDLRRTCGSWLAQDGAALLLIGRVLNHSTPSTTAVYAHLADESVRAALDRHAERLAVAVGFQPTFGRASSDARA